MLQTDMELVILPIDGVLHDVQPGDTLEGIAEEYDVAVEDIIAYADNHLEFPYRLYPETQIMVPGAVREVFVWTPPDLASVGGTSRRQRHQAADRRNRHVPISRRRPKFQPVLLVRPPGD